jgi:hypothetical protein
MVHYGPAYFAHRPRAQMTLSRSSPTVHYDVVLFGEQESIARRRRRWRGLFMYTRCILLRR